MRIVIPVVSLEKGGGTRLLHEIGSGLADYGHDVHFVVPQGNRFEYPVRAQVVRVPLLVPEYMPEGDIVLPNFYLTVYSALSGRGMPVRLCLSYEPLFVEDAATARQTYDVPMPILAISDWLRRILLDHTGRRSTVVNPGLDHRVFHPALGGRAPDMVVCIGRAADQSYWFKGFSYFVQAITHVKRIRPNLKVVVASSEMKGHGLPFPATLVQTPTDRQLADLYRQAAVFIFPSLFEGFGLPPLEAMACGAPVVTTACGGISEFARDGENCLMVPPADVDALAQAILRLLGDPHLRARLASAGVETARPWTWIRTVDQMDYLLRRVLNGSFAN